MKLLSKRAAAERVSLHPVSIMRLVRANAFPQPVALGSRRISFLEDEVENWIADRVAERDAGKPDAAAPETEATA